MYAGKTLHILNGDATKDVFRRTELKDEHQLVWREMMCEGPASEYLHDPAFWKRREEYICTRFGEKPEEYFDKVVLEQIRLEAFIDDYSEIVLWFEHDLFCQINMLAVLTLLHQMDLRGKTIFTVSIDHHEEVSGFKGYGQLSPRQLHQLLPHKTELQKSDVTYAHQAWKAYCADDPRELEALASEAPAAFPYLQKAIQLHLQRLPNKDTGLNKIDQQILQVAASEPLTKYELMRKLLEWDNGYGYTDTQFLHLIDRLKPLLYIGDTIAPNTEGIKVMEGAMYLPPTLLDAYSIGGASEAYRWDSELEQVVKVG